MAVAAGSRVARVTNPTLEWQHRVLTEIEVGAEAMTALLAELIKVPSVGGSAEEHSIQADLARVLDTAGLEVDHWQVPLAELVASPGFPGQEVERTEAWGLVGRLPGRGGGRSIMFDGHIDVVPPGPSQAWRGGDPWSAVVVDGVMHGRGACDMKAGVVAAIWATSAMRRVGVPLLGDVLVATVQGEEDGGLGTYALLERGWRADACVIPEPTGLDVVPANGGALTFRLTVRGLAAHASRRTAGVSAIDKLWPVWRALHELETARNRAVDPLFARHDLAYPISIGTLASGVWPSSVPDELVAEGRLGVVLDEPVEDARAALELAVAEAGAADPWLRDHPVEVTWWGGQFASGRLVEGHPLADQVDAAHAAATGGRRPGRWGAPYGSDLRLLAAAGIPTVQYGPGDVDLAHSTDESVPLDQVLVAARTLALLAIDHGGV